MGAAENTPLLRSVSRSFYLSMRFLPAEMREPISIGYLLARLTDTIADAPGLSIEERVAGLDGIRLAIQGEAEAFPELDWIGARLGHEGEKVLVARAPELLEWFRAVGPESRDHLLEVVLTILHGQRWDTTAFRDGAVGACRSADDLLRYTYWVAGSVGEFWTKVGFSTLGGGFSDPENANSLLVAGRRLGQGLQLVNILRDLHEDLPAGRCYLPADELRESGWTGEGIPSPAAVAPVFECWIDVCESHLGETEAYVARLRNARVRFCTRLPMLLARATARELREAGAHRVMSERVRVSRSVVWKEMARAILF